MKTLDRYIFRSFLLNTVLLLVVLLLLRVVADLFFNLDEFLEEQTTLGERMSYIASYYGHNLLVYFIEMGGIVIVASAAFTLARMNHTNELVAMLASGVSLHRVILPIVICAMILSGLVILDQELIIPRVADKLVRDRKLGESDQFEIGLPSDANRRVWYAPRFYPQQEEMVSPVIVTRDSDYRGLTMIFGGRAREHERNGRPGWLVSEPRMNAMPALGKYWPHTPDHEQIYSALTPAQILGHIRREYADEHGRMPPAERISSARLDGIFDATYGMTIRARRFIPVRPADNGALGARMEDVGFAFESDEGVRLGTFVAPEAEWVPDTPQGYWRLTDGKLFMQSSLGVEDLVLWESGKGLNYMSTAALGRALERDQVRNRRMAQLIRHSRLTEPISSLVMLLLALPFILSRERNIKASASLALLAVASFFVFLHVCRQLEMNPLIAAWLPIFVFGPIAVLMLDAVKT